MALKDKLAELWSSSAEPPDLVACFSSCSMEDSSEILEALKLDQQYRWRTERPLLVNHYLEILPRLPKDVDWRQELILGELEAKKHAGKLANGPQHVIDATPELMQTMTVGPEDLATGLSDDLDDFVYVGEDARYRLDRIVGQGGFGRVYLGYDEVLRRQVAVKVPQPRRFRGSDDVEQYLREARTAASLEHPHIVPVYDAGRTPNMGCFVVSKFVDGEDLSKYSKRNLTYQEVVALLASVAEALQHTHNCGLIHRDIKPANIIIDAQGCAYITDFGLAISDDDIAKSLSSAGTPAYMSPEQIRGEGHLISAQTDIFSLGVVLYELLTREHPFKGASVEELMRAIQDTPPIPLRQMNPSIPAELERICLKSLSKRAVDRYACAADLAADLRDFSTQPSLPSLSSSRVVPRGLQSFDSGDADFFLTLLPGPHDRHGIPETLRFWKSRVENNNANTTFRTGIVYGPSGCGKSSLIKAGLIPRLPAHVQSVFVEATTDATVDHILRGIRRVCPEIQRESSLTDTLSVLRRGRGLPSGHKLLLVIDQFEQFLNADNGEQRAELTAALRQCDGVRVQALLLVRDDFWMPITEFCRSLEVPILEGVNALSVSLFDPEHARKVLKEFGTAYGCLPENRHQITTEQNEFIRLSVEELSHDGKVICVRLALFAEMMKRRNWVPRELRAVGGSTGVGTTFLEETFSSSFSPATMKQHETAARAVLNSLLPEPGSDIKGKRKTLEELREASGYVSQPEEFAALIRVLSNDLRLITATGSDEDQRRHSDTGEAPRYYQLTHDYLVPSLRDWFTRRQRETKRGRAELRLEEQTAIWSVRKELRFLPAFSDWIQIRLNTPSATWTDQQRLMMSQATRYYRTRISIAVAGTLLITLFSFVFYWQASNERSNRLAAEARENQRREIQSARIEASLERGTESIRKDDHPAAFSELQQLLAFATDLHDENLRRKIAKFGQEVDAVPAFEEARVRRCGMPSCQFDYEHFNPDNILKGLSVDFESDASDQLVSIITESSIKNQIIAAIDDWSWVVSQSKTDSYRKLLPKLIEVCNRVDASPTRVKIRNALLMGDFKTLGEVIAAEEANSPDMNATSRLFIANALERSGKGQQAVDVLLRAVEVYPGDFWINLRLAELARQSLEGSDELYLKHLQIARALRPENSVLLSNLASEYMRLGRHDEALRLLQKASGIHSEDAAVQHNIAIWHSEQGQEDIAESIYETILTRFPDFVPSHVNLAIIRSENDESETAMELIQRALFLQREVCDRSASDNGDQKNLAVIAAIEANFLYNEGKLSQAEKLQSEAINILRKAAERDSRAGDLLERQLRTAAEWAEEQGNSSHQIQLLKEAAALNTAETRGVTLWKLASAHASIEDREAALDYICQAADSLPAAENLAANILLNAAILHAIKFGEVRDSLKGNEPVPDEYAKKAVNFLRMAHQRNFFSKVHFGILLTQEPELEPFRTPLADQGIFWAFVVEVFQAGFKESPEAWDDFNTPAAYLSARAALLAAETAIQNPGDVPVEFRRSQFRAQAYQWILPGLRSTWKTGENRGNEPIVQATLAFWLQDPFLKSIRNESELERLPDSERSVWQEFWKAVRSRQNDHQLPFPELKPSIVP